MGRFFLRHWTATLIIIVAGWWLLFYLPASPSYAVFQMKRAIDARDGEAAARYIDFQSVVHHAATEMVEQKGGDPISQLLGEGAVNMLIKPLSDAARAYAVRKVDDGDPAVQMPPQAVLGTLILLHRDGDVASTKFTDPQNRQWDIEMARNSDGVWQITEVKNAAQLIRALEEREPHLPPMAPPANLTSP